LQEADRGSSAVALRQLCDTHWRTPGQLAAWSSTAARRINSAVSRWFICRPRG